MSLKNRGYVDDGLVCIDCTDRTKFFRNANEDIWRIIDHLSTIVVKKDLEQMEKETGFSRNAAGLLRDVGLRRVVKPADAYLRDWMHTFVSGGQANTHTGLLLHMLKDHGIKIELVRDYSIEYTLPCKHGKVSPHWLKKTLLDKKDKGSFSSFASHMLSIVPIVFAFLMDHVHTSAHAGELADHIRCYGLLASIIALLQRVDTAPSNVAHLVRLIDEYGAMFIRLYDRAKAKFHHMYHIHESIERFNRVLSCFVTERRHRMTKRAALHIFRHVEATVMKDLVNRMSEEFAGDSSLFKPTYLVRPKVAPIAMDRELYISSAAVLLCGSIKKRDVVYINDGLRIIVGRVDRFWLMNGQIVVRIACYRCVGNDKRFWSTDSEEIQFFSANSIVDAVAWRPVSAAIVRILPPFVA